MAEKKNYQQKKIIEQVNEDYGRVPPQAIELEEAVLGALMLEKGAIIEISDILTAPSFYVEAHQKIFKVILHLSEEHKPIDILTVTEELRKREELEEIGGAYYIAQLTSRVASSAHLEFHARIIAQKHIQRELIRVASDIQNKAYDASSDVDDLLDFSERELFNISSGNIKKDITSIKPIVDEAIRQIEESSQREDGLTGTPCGFTALDRMTNGWQPSDMIIVAARPSMGKTSFVLSMTRNIAVEHRVPVAFFSLEMSNIQLVNRLISSETGLPSEKIRTGKLQPHEWEQLENRIQNLAEAPIFLDDTPAITTFELRAKCRRLKMQHDIQIVIIDYLQLMTGPAEVRGSREQEVSHISRGLKAIAKELNIPIIALSQLNRSVEMRAGDKRPQLSDLRESGAIEQDADIVIFIHRPERYGITEDEAGNSTLGIAEIIVAKHRNGAVGDVKLRFISDLAKFTDLEGDSFSPLGNDFDLGGSTTTETRVFSSKMNEDSQKFDPLSSNVIIPSSEVPF